MEKDSLDEKFQEIKSIPEKQKPKFAILGAINLYNQYIYFTKEEGRANFLTFEDVDFVLNKHLSDLKLKENLTDYFNDNALIKLKESPINQRELYTLVKNSIFRFNNQIRKTDPNEVEQDIKKILFVAEDHFNDKRSKSREKGIEMTKKDYAFSLDEKYI